MKLPEIIYRFLIMLFFTGIVFAQHPRDLKKPSEVKFKPEKPTEFTLSNGIKVFYLQNKDLPLISFGALIKTGSLYEPAEKTGLASITGTTLRTGGTKTLDGDKIDEELDFLSATLETSMGSEFANISAECLKNDFKRVLDIFADIILNPEFKQEKVDLAKNQMKETIRRRWDRPERVASDIFEEKIYGLDNPLGRRVTVKTINNIKREDILDFHNHYFAPNNTYISISGDISVQEAKTQLENTFKNWKKKNIKFPDIPSLIEKADGTIYYVKKETPQANVYIGHLGIKRNSPDQYKIELLNNIFGGGFTARLNKELRSNRGLTYGIRGGVYAGKDKGAFQISSQLKAEKFIEALTVIKEIIKEIQNNPVSDKEIEQAKNFTANSFVFRFEQKDRYLAQYMNQRINGYTDDYLEKYMDNINKVTKKDIQEAARKYMDLEKMIVVVVGNEKKFDKPLLIFGKIVEIDINKIMETDQSEK